jgi:hypothetical protein
VAEQFIVTSNCAQVFVAESTKGSLAFFWKRDASPSKQVPTSRSPGRWHQPHSSCEWHVAHDVCAEQSGQANPSLEAIITFLHEPKLLVNV